MSTTVPAFAILSEHAFPLFLFRSRLQCASLCVPRRPMISTRSVFMVAFKSRFRGFQLLSTPSQHKRKLRCTPRWRFSSRLYTASVCLWKGHTWPSSRAPKRIPIFSLPPRVFVRCCVSICFIASSMRLADGEGCPRCPPAFPRPMPCPRRTDLFWTISYAISLSAVCTGSGFPV